MNFREKKGDGKCKGIVKRRFTGGDEGVLCTKHWKEDIREIKHMRKY